MPPDGESVPDADDSAIRFHGNRKDAAPQGDNSLFSSSDGTLNVTESESQEETETDDENKWKSETDSKEQNETKIENERKESNERRYERQSENETESEGENASQAKSERDSTLPFMRNQRETGSWKNAKFTPKTQESLLKNSSSFRFRTNFESETYPSRITGDALPAAETSSNWRSDAFGTNPRKRSLRNGQTASNQSCETLQCLRGGECSMNRDGNRFPRCLCPMGTRGNRCQEG